MRYAKERKKDRRKKKDGASGLRIVPSVLAAVTAALVCFFAAAAGGAAVMYALDAGFEYAYLGYLAAEGISCAVSSVIFVRRSGLPKTMAAPVWALASVAVHAAALGILKIHGEHRLPILLTAAIASLAFGFLFARVRKD